MAPFFITSFLRGYSRIIIFVALFLIAPASLVLGQRKREEPPPLKERLFFGGNFGLQFGTYTDVQVSPVVGLWVLPRLAVAAGPTFRYYKYYSTSTNLYGGNAYLQFVPIQDLNNLIPIGLHTGIFIQLEDELLSLRSSYWKLAGTYTNDRFLVNTLFLGPGISQQIGRRSSLNLSFLWALTDSGYTLYNDPEIRISFNF